LQGRASLPAIRRLAKQITERFQPDRIVLFGSYAYGKPHAFSDVDLLVVMPARNELDKAVRILNVLDPPFSVDLIVCTPYNFSWRLEEGDCFLREVASKGKLLYESLTSKHSHLPEYVAATATKITGRGRPCRPCSVHTGCRVGKVV
jgi:predicted nucleotidyltransferase